MSRRERSVSVNAHIGGDERAYLPLTSLDQTVSGRDGLIDLAAAALAAAHMGTGRGLQDIVKLAAELAEAHIDAMRADLLVDQRRRVATTMPRGTEGAVHLITANADSGKFQLSIDTSRDGVATRTAQLDSAPAVFETAVMALALLAAKTNDDAAIAIGRVPDVIEMLVDENEGIAERREFTVKAIAALLSAQANVRSDLAELDDVLDDAKQRFLRAHFGPYHHHIEEN